jgi:uncharacterized protein YjiK
MQILQSFAAGLCLWLCSSSPELPVRQHIPLKIPEPSDLYFAPDGQSFWVVSDKGRIYNVDLSGKILQQKRYKGHDFEAICLYEGRLWAADETYRRLITFDPANLSLAAERQYQVPGALNEGWEALCPHPRGTGLLAVTEKDPVRAYTFSADGTLEGHEILRELPEVSGICLWKGELWAVSDEERRVYRLAADFSILGSWQIPVLNPEGIAIAPDGTLWIVSDDQHRVYQFDLPV